MPNTWFFIVIFAIVPLVLYLRGRGIVAMSLGVACLYGVSVSIFVLTQILPPQFLGWLLDVLTPDNSSANRYLFDSYYIIANYRAAVLPAITYSGVAAIFWILNRAQAPVSKPITTALFWLLHLTVLAIASYQISFSNDGMPRRYVEYDDSFNSYLLITGIAEMLIFLALAGLALTAIWSLAQRLRTHAL